MGLSRNCYIPPVSRAATRGVDVMGIESSVEKLDKYFKRLSKGKAQKIKPSHVEKVIHKLEKKEELLLEEIKEADKDSKVERLKRKQDLLREQQDRARWLLKEISKQ